MKEIIVHGKELSDINKNWQEHCLYNQILHNCEFISKEENGYSIYQYKDKKFKIKFGSYTARQDSNIINILPFTYFNIYNLEKLNDGKNWLPLIISGEKVYPVDLLNILGTDVLPSYSYHNIENMITEFKDFTFYTDQLDLELHEYKNEFLLTNTLYFWNRVLNMTLAYLYADLLDKIKFEYKFGFTINRQTRQRSELAKKLLKKEYCYVSQLKDPYVEEWWSIDSNIKINDISDETPFFNLYKTKFFFQFDMFEQNLDMFFKIYFNYEIHIVDETWAGYDCNFKSVNISEKLLIPIFLNRPFITTHIYPLKFLDKAFSVGKHPFYNEIEKISANVEKIDFFIEEFNKNYEDNTKKCREYTNKIRNEIVFKLKNENSLLEKIL